MRRGLTSGRRGDVIGMRARWIDGRVGEEVGEGILYTGAAIGEGRRGWGCGHGWMETVVGRRRSGLRAVWRTVIVVKEELGGGERETVRGRVNVETANGLRRYSMEPTARREIDGSFVFCFFVKLFRCFFSNRNPILLTSFWQAIQTKVRAFQCIPSSYSDPDI